MRAPDEVARFFGGLDLVEPDLVPITRWRPDSTEVGEPREVDEFGAVGRKPWARRVDRSPTTRSNVGRPTLGLEKIRTLHIGENYPLNSTKKAPRKETPGENGAGPNR
ncbi:SAM-dependent methyltransferase [Nocardiopsis listeri]|uniref:SAM-dependent methyltransferase n=1 Tax=Nocardiopsis listeri TaxID=53440 RepID=UPI001CC202FF|nr:SAM-dependent methyltransferase [Nocardiopsis listeri]